MDIGKKIFMFRTYLGLHQDEFAKRAGLSPWSIHNWETGKFIPMPKKVEQIERAFDVQLSTVKVSSAMRYRNLKGEKCVNKNNQST